MLSHHIIEIQIQQGFTLSAIPPCLMMDWNRWEVSIVSSVQNSSFYKQCWKIARYSNVLEWMFLCRSSSIHMFVSLRAPHLSLIKHPYMYFQNLYIYWVIGSWFYLISVLHEIHLGNNFTSWMHCPKNIVECQKIFKYSSSSFCGILSRWPFISWLLGIVEFGAMKLHW